MRKFIAGVILCFCATAAIAQDKRGPSTAEERDKAVKAARLLESDPFSKDAKNTRAWALNWLIQVPDISVTLCSGYFPPLFERFDKNYAFEIANQMALASAAFVIEHPGRASDRIAVNLAGLEGSLRIYETILKTKPKARWPFLDDLIAKREAGQLRAYVEKVAATECAK